MDNFWADTEKAERIAASVEPDLLSRKMTVDIEEAALACLRVDALHARVAYHGQRSVKRCAGRVTEANKRGAEVGEHPTLVLTVHAVLVDGAAAFSDSDRCASRARAVFNRNRAWSALEAVIELTNALSHDEFANPRTRIAIGREELNHAEGVAGQDATVEDGHGLVELSRRALQEVVHNWVVVITEEAGWINAVASQRHRLSVHVTRHSREAVLAGESCALTADWRVQAQKIGALPISIDDEVCAHLRERLTEENLAASAVIGNAATIGDDRRVASDAAKIAPRTLIHDDLTAERRTFEWMSAAGKVLAKAALVLPHCVHCDWWRLTCRDVEDGDRHGVARHDALIEDRIPSLGRLRALVERVSRAHSRADGAVRVTASHKLDGLRDRVAQELSEADEILVLPHAGTANGGHASTELRACRVCEHNKRRALVDLAHALHLAVVTKRIGGARVLCDNRSIAVLTCAVLDGDRLGGTLELVVPLAEASGHLVPCRGCAHVACAVRELDEADRLARNDSSIEEGDVGNE